MERTNSAGEACFVSEEFGLHWVQHADFRPVGPFFGRVQGSCRILMEDLIRVHLRIPIGVRDAIAPILKIEEDKRPSAQFPPIGNVAVCASFIDIRSGLRWSRAGVGRHTEWVLSRGGVGNRGLGIENSLMPPCGLLSSSSDDIEVEIPSAGVYAIVLTAGRRQSGRGPRYEDPWPDPIEYVEGPEFMAGIAVVADSISVAFATNVDRVPQAFDLALDDAQLSRIRELWANFDRVRYTWPPGWSGEWKAESSFMLQYEASSRPKTETRSTR